MTVILSKYMDTAHYGDENCGFTVEFDPETHRMAARAWGFWDTLLGQKLSSTLIEGCGNRPRIGELHLDLDAFKPMRDEVESEFVRMLSSLGEMPSVRAISFSTRSPLTKLQLLRIISQQGLKERVRFRSSIPPKENAS